VTALIANAWTFFYVVLIIGWQITSLLRKGIWPSLPMSSVIKKLGSDHDTIYVTASIHNIESSIVDVLLGVPVIAILLVASALLTAFYLWLLRTEQRYSKN